MNYGNRNASSQYTTKDLGRGYAGAVFVSCGLALITRTMFAKQIGKFTGAKLVVANASLSYICAAPAGAANVTLMRYKEVDQGIMVQNRKGDVEYGKSKQAGKNAIRETAISRCVLPIPVLFLPSVFNGILSKLRLMPKNQAASKLIELSFVLCSLTFALPMSIAMFEQRSSLSRTNIDEEMREIKPKEEDEENKDKEFVDMFYFNKGL